MKYPMPHFFQHDSTLIVIVIKLCQFSFSNYYLEHTLCLCMYNIAAYASLHFTSIIFLNRWHRFSDIYTWPGPDSFAASKICSPTTCPFCTKTRAKNKLRFFFFLLPKRLQPIRKCWTLQVTQAASLSIYMCN